ncbi:MAG: N-acetyl-gamma-glutamyl-phosphate reductase [Myxococcales bacterium]|nr:N-acetyl-gamma-glutamyl-phosphate reductase [Myxococcota bacterium]MDW8280990.1 N-acetyl-gamma-glutamyl-phosphate reductase [Myxococcales bacterium]
MKRYKAAVLGGSGYGGGEMIRRLLLHPEVELCRVCSVDYIGEPLSAAHPNLEGLPAARGLVFEQLTPAEAARGMDVVLLGLPHRVSAQQVPSLLDEGVRVVDLSGDFRLRDAAAYAAAYGGEHPAPALLGSFVYGLPEQHRERIRTARRVASPGCFATTVELALLPLARAGLLRGAEVQVVGITGSSGSGVVPTPATHHPTRSVNLRTYKPLSHQHVPEILQLLEDAGGAPQLRFVPVSAPLSRGLFATCFVSLPAALLSPASIDEMYRAAYADEPFVRVPERRLPEVAAVAGSNYAEVGVQVGEVEGGRRTVVCFAALDNLIKGGAGQGIQNMNLMLGLPETLTLEDPGGWP